MKGIALTLALVLLPLSLAAEVLYLRSGQILIGRMVSQNRKVVRIRVNGRIRTIPKKRIRRISYDEATGRRILARRAKARKQKEERRKAAARRKAEARKKAEEQRKAAARKRTEERRKAEEQKRAEERRRRAAAKGAGGTPEPGSPLLGALWRSALVPGWGLWNTGRKGEGIAALSGTLIGLGYAYSSVAAGRSAKNEYDNQVVLNTILVLGPLSSSRLASSLLLNLGQSESYRDKLDQANTAMGVAGLVYLVQLAYTAWTARSGSPKPSAGQVPRSDPRFFATFTSASPSPRDGARTIRDDGWVIGFRARF